MLPDMESALAIQMVNQVGNSLRWGAETIKARELFAGKRTLKWGAMASGFGQYSVRGRAESVSYSRAR